MAWYLVKQRDLPFTLYPVSAGTTMHGRQVNH